MSKIKQWIKKQIPTRESLENNRFIKPFAPILKQSPNYWRFNRHSVSTGCAVAVFGAFMPIPFQTIIAIILALPLRANLVLSIGLLWINNPITIVPMYWLCYRVGAWVLQMPQHHVDLHLSWHWVTHELTHIWKPFLLGCFICGTVFAVLMYFAILATWRFIAKRIQKQQTTK